MTSHATEWVFIGAVAAALYALHWMRRVFWLFSVLALPGTFVHEACHYLSGILLNGGPVSFTILPRREGSGWAMGSVAFNHLRWYNAFFIGLAPLLMLPAAYGLALWRLQGRPTFGWQEGLAVFAIANLVYGAVPSWQDVRIAAKSPVGWLLLAGGLAWGWNAIQKGQSPARQVRLRPSALAR